ncbi:protein MpNPF7 [Marchantia polymorpha subsp. ruderalis]
MTPVPGMKEANSDGNGFGRHVDPESNGLFEQNQKINFLGPVAGHRDGSEMHLESRELMVDWRGRVADKRKTGTWKAAWFLNVLNLTDTVVLTSIGLNLVTFMTIELHQSVAKASNYANHFLGAANLFSVFWGFVADAYLGKYWTIASSLLIYLAGLATLTFAATSDSLKPPDCVPTLTSSCPPAGNRIMTPIVVALYVIAVGSGGVRPTTSAMGAEQFDDTEPVEKAQGVRFFVFYFLAVQLGLLLATSLMVYISTSASMGALYGTGLGLMALGMASFYAGTHKYRYKPPSGSALTRMAQVLVAAARKWNVRVPDDKSLLFESKSELSAIKGTRKLQHSPFLTFLDKAAVQRAGEAGSAGRAGPWRLCTVTQVEELKRMLSILPIWMTMCLVYVSYAQISSVTVAMGMTMDRHVGPNFQIPPVSLVIFAVLITVASIPFYEKLLLPLARRATGNPQGLSPLQRIGTGMVLVTAAYLVAAAVETKRLAEIRSRGLERSPVGTFVLPMRVFWLVPVYAILAVVEVFTAIGQLQFFYDEATDGTRSLGMAFFFASVSLGYFLATAVVDAVESSTGRHGRGGWLTGRFNDGGLRSYFFLLAVIMAVDFLVFLVFAHFYRYKKLSTDDGDDESGRHLELRSQNAAL